jgi:hypothetical protein
VTATPQKITFGEMRESGVREVLIYCRDHHCSHHVEISADRWPDDVRLSDIEPGSVCSACGKRGTDVRPLFEPARMGTA